MLTAKQVEAYKRDGYVKAEGLFTPDEVEEFGSAMNWIIKEWWGEESMGWRGPWRDDYLSEAERENTRAVFIGNPQFYSAGVGTGCLPRGACRVSPNSDRPRRSVAPHNFARQAAGVRHPRSRCIRTIRFTRTTAQILSIASFTLMIRPLIVDVCMSFPAATRTARSNTSQVNIPVPISRQSNTILTK